MRADPWQIIRTGMSGTASTRRFTLRDVLLVAQIAICAVLVTSSLVAVRGLVRSLHSNFGFQPQNAMLVESDLHMAGYADDRVAADAAPHDRCGCGHSRRRRAVGYTSDLPLSLGGGDSFVYTDTTTDFRPTNFAADAMNYNISPGYLAGRRHDACSQARDLTPQRQQQDAQGRPGQSPTSPSKSSAPSTRPSAAISSTGAESAQKSSASSKTANTAP